MHWGALPPRRRGPSPFNWTFAYDRLGNVHTLNDVLGSADAQLSYQNVDKDRLCRIHYGDHGFPWPWPWRTCNVEHDALGNVIGQPTRSYYRQLGYFSSGDVRSISQG